MAKAGIRTLNGVQVLIWNGLAGGNSQYCAVLVAVNSVLQMILYAH